MGEQLQTTTQRFYDAEAKLCEAKIQLMQSAAERRILERRLNGSFMGALRNGVGYLLNTDNDPLVESLRNEIGTLRLEQEKIDNERRRVELEKEKDLKEKVHAGAPRPNCVVCLDEEQEVDITFLPCG